jgi:hypothetical protein
MVLSVRLAGGRITEVLKRDARFLVSLRPENKKACYVPEVRPPTIALAMMRTVLMGCAHGCQPRPVLLD